MKPNPIIMTEVDGETARIDLAAGRVEVQGVSYPLQITAGSGQGEFENDEEE